MIRPHQRAATRMVLPALAAVAFAIMPIRDTRATAPFVIEVADPGPAFVGMFSSLALDSQGNPRISYYDDDDGNLKYASRSVAGVWTREVADGSTSVVGWYSSLAIDGSNVPHISYYNVTTGRLWYAKKPGVLWTKEQVDGLDSDVGTDCNIRLDGSGLPGISYYDFTNQNLKYAHRSAGGVWTAENADESEDDSGRFSSLAFDGSGNPCISYYNSSTGQLMYARKSGGVWSHEVVDPSTDNRGQFSSLRIDGAGRPCISYYDANNQDLLYAWKNGASWVIETANGAEDLDVGRESALALDIAGGPHITFYDNTNQHWLYAHKVGGAWQTMTVDATFNVRGQFGSIQMTAGGIPRMSCFDATAATLLYAYGPSENVSVGDRPRTSIASLSVFPNPSPAGVTRIHWVGEGLAPDAAVDILDAGGRRIRRLPLDASGEARWDGTDDRGRAVRAGINFVKPVGVAAASVSAVRLVVVR